MKAWDALVRGFVWCHEFFMDTVWLMSNMYGVFVVVMFLSNIMLAVALLSTGSAVGFLSIGVIAAMLWLVVSVTNQYRKGGKDVG